MTRLTRLFSFILLGIALFSFGCSNHFSDAVPTSISPPYFRVKVNDTITVSVFLSQPRQEAGKVKFSISDTNILRPAVTPSEVNVEKGTDVVFYEVQGIKAGEAILYAELDGVRVQARVIVTED